MRTLTPRTNDYPEKKLPSKRAERARSFLFAWPTRQRTFLFTGASNFYYTTVPTLLSSKKLHKFFNRRIPFFVQSDETKKNVKNCISGVDNSAKKAYTIIKR